MKKPAAADGGYNNGRQQEIYVSVCFDTTGDGRIQQEIFYFIEL